MARVVWVSCGWAVLVDQPAAGRGAADRPAEFEHFGVVLVVGCLLVEASMRAVLVVVLHELVEQPVELALVPDQGSVEQFVSDAADPAFRKGIGFWGAWWGGDRVCTDGSEDVVEGPGVLASAVMDDEPDRLLVCHREVARGLGGPWAGRVGSDAGEVHAAGVKLDEEQDMEAA